MDQCRSQKTCGLEMVEMKVAICISKYIDMKFGWKAPVGRCGTANMKLKDDISHYYKT